MPEKKDLVSIVKHLRNAARLRCGEQISVVWLEDVFDMMRGRSDLADKVSDPELPGTTSIAEIAVKEAPHNAELFAFLLEQGAFDPKKELWIAELKKTRDVIDANVALLEARVATTETPKKRRAVRAESAARGDTQRRLLAVSLLSTMKKANAKTAHDFIARCPELVFCEDSQGFLLIHVAAGAGNVDAVKVLLDAGSDPNAVNRDGTTSVLHESVDAGSEELVEELLRRDAKISFSVDWRGLGRRITPVDLAVRQEKWSIASSLVRKTKALYKNSFCSEIVEASIEHGAPVSFFEDLEKAGVCFNDVHFRRAVEAGRPNIVGVVGKALKREIGNKHVSNLASFYVYSAVRSGDHETLKKLVELGGKPYPEAVDALASLDSETRKKVSEALHAAKNVDTAQREHRDGEKKRRRRPRRKKNANGQNGAPEQNDREKEAG